jgi:hypothetical protein
MVKTDCGLLGYDVIPAERLPENGSSMFLQSVGNHLQDRAVSQPTKSQSKLSLL